MEWSQCQGKGRGSAACRVTGVGRTSSMICSVLEVHGTAWSCLAEMTRFRTWPRLSAKSG